MALGETRLGATPCCGYIIRKYERYLDSGKWYTVPYGAPEFEEEKSLLDSGICPECRKALRHDPWFKANGEVFVDNSNRPHYRWDYNEAAKEYWRRREGREARGPLKVFKADICLAGWHTVVIIAESRSEANRLGEENFGSDWNPKFLEELQDPTVLGPYSS